jgi:hypothetical protein
MRQPNICRIGQILYIVEMANAIAANKNKSTIPVVRGVVDLSVALSAAKRPGFPSGLIGMAEGAAEGLDQGYADGATEGMSNGATEGLVAGAAEGELEGLAEGTADGVTEGTTEGAAEGLVVGAAGGDTEGSVGPSLSPGRTKSGRSHREGENVSSSNTASSALLCR